MAKILWGAALVLAGLQAEGGTRISLPEHIDRGYENIERDLTRLGARIVRRETREKAEELWRGQDATEDAEGEGIPSS